VAFETALSLLLLARTAPPAASTPATQMATRTIMPFGAALTLSVCLASMSLCISSLDLVSVAVAIR
jgi:hypothetical protein